MPKDRHSDEYVRDPSKNPLSSPTQNAMPFSMFARKHHRHHHRRSADVYDDHDHEHDSKHPHHHNHHPTVELSENNMWVKVANSIPQTTITLSNPTTTTGNGAHLLHRHSFHQKQPEFKQPRSLGKIPTRAPAVLWLGGILYFLQWGYGLGALIHNTWHEFLSYDPGQYGTTNMNYEPIIGKDAVESKLLIAASVIGAFGWMTLFARLWGFFMSKPYMKWFAWVLLFVHGCLLLLCAHIYAHDHPLSASILGIYPNATAAEMPDENTYGRWSLPSFSGNSTSTVRFGPGMRYLFTGRNLFVAAVLMLFFAEMLSWHDRHRFRKLALAAIHDHGIRRYQLADYYRYILATHLRKCLKEEEEKQEQAKKDNKDNNDNDMKSEQEGRMRSQTESSLAMRYLHLHDAMKQSLTDEDIQWIYFYMYRMRDRISSTQSKTMMAVVLMYVTINVGAAIYTVLEGWYIDIAISFCTETITTIGYGAPAPLTWGGRAFLFLYFPIGFVTIGYTIKTLFDVILKAINQFVEFVRVHTSKWKDLQLVILHQLELEHPEWAKEKEKQPQTKPEDEKKQTEQKSSDPSAKPDTAPKSKLLSAREAALAIERSNTHDALILVIIFVLGLSLLGAKVYSDTEGWTYFNALYFTFVTLTSIGYGDLVPVQESTATFFTWFVVLGIGSLAYILTLLADKSQQAVEARLLSAHQSLYQKTRIRQLRRKQRRKLAEQERAKAKAMEIAQEEAVHAIQIAAQKEHELQEQKAKHQAGAISSPASPTSSPPTSARPAINNAATLDGVVLSISSLKLQMSRFLEKQQERSKRRFKLAQKKRKKLGPKALAKEKEQEAVAASLSQLEVALSTFLKSVPHSMKLAVADPPGVVSSSPEPGVTPTEIKITVKGEESSSSSSSSSSSDSDSSSSSDSFTESDSSEESIASDDMGDSDDHHKSEIFIENWGKRARKIQWIRWKKEFN